MLAHFSGDVGGDFVSVLEPDAELGVGQRLRDLALDLDTFLFRHANSFDRPRGPKTARARFGLLGSSAGGAAPPRQPSACPSGARVTAPAFRLAAVSSAGKRAQLTPLHPQGIEHG